MNFICRKLKNTEENVKNLLKWVNFVNSHNIKIFYPSVFDTRKRKNKNKNKK